MKNLLEYLILLVMLQAISMTVFVMQYGFNPGFYLGYIFTIIMTSFTCLK